MSPSPGPAEEGLHIGEVARRTGYSVHALRYYEAEGLIPNVRRDGGGRRVYTNRHVLWLELLAKLRATGMSIEDVRGYADLIREGDGTLEARQALLRDHRERVEAQIGELRTCMTLIDRKIGMYQEWLEAGGSPLEVPEAVEGEPDGDVGP